jgi:hypothetical protein
MMLSSLDVLAEKKNPNKIHGGTSDLAKGQDFAILRVLSFVVASDDTKKMSRPDSCRVSSSYKVEDIPVFLFCVSSLQVLSHQILLLQ